MSLAQNLLERPSRIRGGTRMVRLEFEQDDCRNRNLKVVDRAEYPKRSATK
jgi:hypothetical protein